MKFCKGWGETSDNFTINRSSKDGLEDCCRICRSLGIYTYDNLEVDHIIPIVEAPELCLDLNNLQVLCKKHHSEKTAKENGADRFCMGAAWRKPPRGEQFDRVLTAIKEVKNLGMETCVTLGLLSTLASIVPSPQMPRADRCFQTRSAGSG